MLYKVSVKEKLKSIFKTHYSGCAIKLAVFVIAVKPCISISLLPEP